MDPEFWANPQGAQELMKSLKADERWVENFSEMKMAMEDLEVLFEFWKEK